MGLDIVELVMRIEEEFEIEIPDEDAETLETVGRIADYVAERRKLPADQMDWLWEKVRAIVVDEIGISPDRVRRSSRLVDDLGMD